MSEPFILCEGLVKIYQVAELEMVALQGLNLTVEQGELVGIVGASGSGKSTLMNILGGLDRPTAGRVRVDGHDLLRMPDRQLNRYRREKVGFVWQQATRNLVPYLNAVHNVMLPMTLAGVAGREKRRRAEQLLEVVGLSERKHHRLTELSGGEQQRVAIAVALANSPTLLLADEPTGEVDSVTAKVIYHTFQTLTRDLGITTLIVSHDPGIARHVDRVVAIRDGMLASETIRQAVAQPLEGMNGEEATAEEESFAELVVLDNAGRVHIPQEFLEQFSIKGRAQLELTEEGILIRPALQTRTEQVRVDGARSRKAETKAAKAKVSGNGRLGGMKNLFSKLGRKRKTEKE
jgi:ABC-type lipoprotein export system ATPase subunit/bifunctional DNA-binding transcriptional regulator/antitoxin component of YhaV-PrlF toxin-antitoxin module